MNEPLSSKIALVEQSDWGFRFRLDLHNESSVKLFLPDPSITDLRFVDAATGKEATWLTSMLVQMSDTGFVLEAGAGRSFGWKVRPASIETEDETDFDYYRWCLGLHLAEYEVSHRWVVDDGFFDGDTHVRMPELLRAAFEEGAVAWQGEAVSNVVAVTYR